jgi:hypothetical protein
LLAAGSAALGRVPAPPPARTGGGPPVGTPALPAEPGEARAIQVVQNLGGSITRDPKAPGRPVVAVAPHNLMEPILKEVIKEWH